MAEKTVLMLRPGFEDILYDVVLVHVRNMGLEATLWGWIELREKHILVLYPEQLYTDWYGGLRDYLVSAPVPVFLITGEEAIQKTVMLKNDLRRRYARGRHQQVFHCPFSGEEWRRNMKFFSEMLGSNPV